jgi:hypothetical protein
MSNRSRLTNFAGADRRQVWSSAFKSSAAFSLAGVRPGSRKIRLATGGGWVSTGGGEKCGQKVLQASPTFGGHERRAYEIISIP